MVSYALCYKTILVQGTLTEGESLVRLTSFLFGKKTIMFALSKAADQNLLEQGGQMHWVFPFRKGFLT